MRLFALIAFVLFGLQTYSQLDFGEYNTPYAGVHSLSFNPAEIVDSRYKFHMNLLGVGMTGSNNFMGISSALMSVSPPEVNDSNKNTYFIKNLNGKDKHAYLMGNLALPSAFMSFGAKNKFSLGLSANLKMLVSANNISEKLAQYLYDDKDTTSYKPSSSKDFMLNTSVWTSIGLTVGTVIFDKPKFGLKAAVTPKVNFGIFNIYGYSDNLYTHFPDSKYLNKANGILDLQASTVFQVNGKGHADSFKIFQNMGLGVDVGFIYEKRDGKNYNYTMDCKDDNVRKDLNKYSYRIGLSLIDFGYINWKGLAPIRRIFFDSALMTTPINKDIFNDYPDWTKGNGKLIEQALNGYIVDTTKNVDYYMWTPSKVNAFADVHVYKGIYLALNGTYTFVNNNYASSLTQHMQFNFTPRIESKAFGFYLPIQYNGLAEEVNIGMGMRLFCMNFGLYDWTGIAGFKDQTKNFGFNLSFNIPIHQRAQPKDDDHDLMSNKKDKCKGLAGDCNSDGCPLPDDDEDGVDNTQDKCPNVKGPKSLDGCPDTDEDGIPDSKDRCPKKKGPKELGGCPDKDGDGIIDTEDKCPSDKGPKSLDGCPDRDGDRIPDNIDECPTDSGVFENRGCPAIIIKDSDNDGILDTADKCPNVAGPMSNKGCPVPVEVISVAKMAQDKLEFQTGSAIIKSESIYSLTVLAEYLTKYPTYNLDLKGHTDNVGNEDKNLKLSIDRSNAVKNFFITKGISPSRITSDGFGMKYPIADNRTPAGRAVNRRVEIEIK